jgi:hypothetical protein
LAKGQGASAARDGGAGIGAKKRFAVKFIYSFYLGSPRAAVYKT